MLPVTGFVDCCDAHDICYDTCGADKDECDLKFKKCLYRKCSSVKDSEDTALNKKSKKVPMHTFILTSCKWCPV